MLYILHGEDDFSRREALEDIKAGLGAGDLLEANTTILDSKQLTPPQLIAVCNTAPFLAPKRLIIAEGFIRKYESRTDPDQTQEITTLTEYINKIPDTTVLVFVDDVLKSHNPLLKALSPSATVKQYPLLKGDNLKNWCQKRVLKSGGRISEGALSLLVNLVGDNLWTLSSEIDKLILYSDGNPITENDIQMVVSQARQASIFKLVDAVLESRSSEAIQLLHRMLDDGSHPSYLLVMLTRQFRLALQAKELNSQGVKLPQIKQQLGLTYAAEKALAQGRQHSQQRLEKAYHQILEADLSIKRGKFDGETALDILVAELSKPK